MYRYNTIDQTIVQERVNQYRDQLSRFFAGELSEDEFRPLRLQNGLYIQRHTVCCQALNCAHWHKLLSNTTKAMRISPRAKTCSLIGLN